MKASIAHSSYVIDFLDIDFNSDEIGKILKLETDHLLTQVKDDRLIDWELQFKVVYGKGTSIRIFTKGASLIKERLKQITIHIPIPENDQVQWGVNADQLVEVAKPPNEAKNFSFLDVDYGRFATRKEYLLDSVRRAIRYCLQTGFSVNSVKVKIPGA